MQQIRSAATSTNHLGSTVIGDPHEFSPGGSSLIEQGNAKIGKEYHPAETSLLALLSLTLLRSPPAKALSGNPPGLRGPQLRFNNQGTHLTRSSALAWPSFSLPVLVWAVVAHIRERRISALYMKENDLCMPHGNTSLQ